ncbi:hypothetical protein CB0101_08555 [Synechococcus sp. CB0101]|uniref:hypothetical protein n=1 Tax=Synechococcus sp. CB0101 TaxID=232348 RepID=UPI0010AA84F6|nr:hypothetical protein [Synechococcus sp. CB0101]QCH14972.1 hypothetical protein CB0101_08555 [Synechococcus sp. CB0101]
MSPDVITGIWNETKNPFIANWETDDSSTQGYVKINQKGKGKMYVDSNKNGKRDKSDKVIAKVIVLESASDQNNIGFGTWTADLESRTGTIFNQDGVELAITRYKDVSYFI